MTIEKSIEQLFIDGLIWIIKKKLYKLLLKIKKNWYNFMPEILHY